MGGIVSCFSNFLVTAEKLSLWMTCTVLICCLITTITIILGLGIGLGYNYCFIDMLTRYRYVPAHYVYSGSPRWRHGVVDNERRLGPQPVKVTIKPKYTLKTQPTTTTTSTTTTTTEPPPTTTEILTTTDSDIQLSTDITVITADNDIQISPAITVQSDYYDYEVDTRQLKNFRKKLDHKDMNWDTTETDNTAKSASARSFVPNDGKTVPISDLDLISLLSKMRADGKNYKLQIVTT